MMNIKDFINKIELITIVNNNDGNFTHVCFDSREVANNSLFVAIKGTQTDGHKYIDKAESLGASIVVCEEMPGNLNSKITYIQVKSSSYALGIIADYYYGSPSSNIKLIGVTGTNGKTTIATSLYNLTRKLGYKTGLLSTINILIEEREIVATHTTPDPLTINKYLSEMIDSGCEYCFMEVSSHAAAQDRIAGLIFAGGIFTNITHDHLDFHKTFKDYIKAKQKFFDILPKTAFAITNIDDKNGEIIVQNTKAKKYTYSLKSASNYKVKILEKHFDGMLLDIDGQEIWTSFTGKFNAYNLIAIYACAVQLGFEKYEILKALSLVRSVEGRFETILSGTGVSAVVDYAHTPDALKNVIVTINEILEGSGKLICVVGAGGDRDKAKRPEMAEIAVSGSSKLILTSDNPRTEDPEAILDDMMQGVNLVQKKHVLRISNRKEAIRTACMMAVPGDVILVAGKGHEKYQEINGIRHHFDDKEIIVETFKELV